MAKSRLPRIAATAASVGIVALAWFLGAAPQLDAARLAHSDQAVVDAANDVLRERLVTLREQHSRIDAIRSEVGAVRQQSPSAPALPDLVDQITTIAAANGVQVTSYRAEESLAPLANAVAALAAVGLAGGLASGSGAGSGAKRPERAAAARLSVMLAV